MSEKTGKGGLLRSSAVVSVMTLLSRVLVTALVLRQLMRPTPPPGDSE